MSVRYLGKHEPRKLCLFEDGICSRSPTVPPDPKGLSNKKTFLHRRSRIFESRDLQDNCIILNIFTVIFTLTKFNTINNVQQVKKRKCVVHNVQYKTFQYAVLPEHVKFLSVNIFIPHAQCTSDSTTMLYVNLLTFYILTYLHIQRLRSYRKYTATEHDISHYLDDKAAKSNFEPPLFIYLYLSLIHISEPTRPY